MTSSRAMDPGDLMRLHVETLFTLSDVGRLLSINESEQRPSPRFFLGRTAEGNVCYFREDVGPDLAAELEERVRAEPPALPAQPSPELDAAYIELLSRAAPVQRVWTGPTYGFPAELPVPHDIVGVTAANASVLTRYLDAWLADVSEGVPMTAYVYGGDAVAVCCSVRMAERAHEAGVETHRDFRGRGFAAAVVAAWARAVRRLGRVPLFSTSWENVSSRAVAHRLRLIQYGASFHTT
jgi:GNAT superfamily N-acetyltransferase